MLHFFRFSLLLLCLARGATFVAAQSVSKTVYLPLQVEEDVKEAVRDMIYWLGKAGGGHFEIKQTDRQENAGIRLIKSEETAISPAYKKILNSNGQSFYLVTKSIEDVRIIATGKNSFINGIYTFLHELGFRWYMPGDEWVRIGNVNRVPHIDKIYSPDFINRVYAGSGGITPIPGLDDKDTFSVDFITWNRRNRLSVDYTVKGHSGMAFYRENKKELDQHPEYFCNNKVSANPRLNYDRAEAVQMLVNWALAQKTAQDRFPVIGIDPADGSGGMDDCLPVTIPAIKSWSDKYFWLANQVAARLPAASPIRVTMYAYNNYAAPPSFDLLPNVHPFIIPYAFQNVEAPRDFILSWSRKMKGREMGIYDYWNITQWGLCKPEFGLYQVPERLKFWKSNNITSINLESTYSKGAMGHVYWIATQMMWNTKLDFEQLYEEFLTNCYGRGATDIRNMYDRWSKNYQGTAEYILSNEDLYNASRKENDATIGQRLSQLKAYVQYVKMLETYMVNKTKGGYDSLINYVLSVHHLRILHTSALINYYIPKPTGYVAITDKKLLAARNKNIRPLQQSEIENQFQKERRAQPPAYAISSLQWDLTRLVPVKTKIAPANPLKINNINRYRFYVPKQGVYRFDAGSSKTTDFIIRDAGDKVVFRKTIEATPSGTKSLDISLGAGQYVLQWGGSRRSSRVRFPSSLVFVSADHYYDNAGYPWQYYYIPLDVKEVIYQDVLGPGINDRGFWQNPKGERVYPEKIVGNVYRLSVPAQYRGTTWVLNIGHRQFKMLNIPDFSSLNPFEYKE